MNTSFTLQLALVSITSTILVRLDIKRQRDIEIVKYDTEVLQRVHQMLIKIILSNSDVMPLWICHYSSERRNKSIPYLISTSPSYFFFFYKVF